MTDTIPRELIAALTRKAGFYRRYSNDGQTETEALLTAASKALTTALDENEHLRESYGWAVISADTFKDENERLREVIAEIESDAIDAGGADDAPTGNTYGDGAADQACCTLTILAKAVKS